MRRPAPRPLALALAPLQAALAPASLLADVQRVWNEVAGPAIAAEASPTAARGGVLTIVCASSVWAQELDLMGPQIIERLNTAIGPDAVQRLRCVTGTRPSGG
jgi:predicted nucleic acid-binding Zn ribbon protein